MSDTVDLAITPGGRVGDDSPIGKPGGRQNWVDKAGGLPKYMRMIAHALIRKGMPAGRAIATAHEHLERLAASSKNPAVKAAAAQALAEWEAKKKAGSVSLADPAGDAVDLAPGDYRPPYDWKHGYIPLTPAAKLSKAKKGPHAGKGHTKQPRVLAGKAARVKKTTEAQRERVTALAKAKDDEARGRAVPGAVEAARNALNASGPKKAGGVATTGDPRSPERQAADRRAYEAARNAINASGPKTTTPNPTRSGKVAPMNPTATKTSAQKTDESLTTAANARQAAARRAALQNEARAAGYKGNLNSDGSDTLQAFIDAKKQGRPFPVGQAVNARQPGIEKVNTGRVIGYDDKGMVLVKPHYPADAPAGRYNPSHVAEAGREPKHTPDSRESGRATATRSTNPDRPKLKERHALDSDTSPKMRAQYLAQRRAERDSAPKPLDKMTPAELTAERDRLQNIIAGRAGGTATDVDVERWRKRRQAVDAELNDRPGRETQARSRDALRGAREEQEWRNRRDQAARGTLEPTAADLTWASEEWKRRNPGKKLAGNEDAVNKLARARAQDKTDRGVPRTSEAEAASERARVQRGAAEVQRTAKRLADEKNAKPTSRFAPKPAEAPNGRRAGFDRAKTAENAGDYATAAREYDALGDKEAVSRVRVKAIRAGQSLDGFPKGADGKSPGITDATARRMSDAQLERSMERLMADGTYSGPAFAVLEKELDRRDKARGAEGNRPRR